MLSGARSQSLQAFSLFVIGALLAIPAGVMSLLTLTTPIHFSDRDIDIGMFLFSLLYLAAVIALMLVVFSYRSRCSMISHAAIFCVHSTSIMFLLYRFTGFFIQ
jgi:hypothetical protein